MIERKILTGLIMSTEYLQQVQSIWDIRMIESATAKRLAAWVWEYYEKYNAAPRTDIQGIYYAKLKEHKLAKEVAEEIEQEILPSLTEEYKPEQFNVTYLLDETQKYFKERRLVIHAETIQALVTSGNLDEAEKAIGEFKAMGGSIVDISQFILSLAQIRRRQREHPCLLMAPWLRAGQHTILYGNYGSGKSLLSIAVAYVLGLPVYDREECEFGEWQVKTPTGTLYIDGELGEQEMQERIDQFGWLGTQHGLHRIRVLSIPEYQLATEDSFYLSNRVNQLKIVHWLRDHPTYKLVVLDSVSTLFGLVNENDNSEWSSKIDPLLRDLRALGVACLLLHHAGKEAKKGLRGASAMGSMAQNVFRLTNHPDKGPDDGEAWFTLTKDKQRGGGYLFRTFSLHFMQENNDRETHWETTDNS